MTALSADRPRFGSKHNPKFGHGDQEQPSLAENDRVRFTIADAARAKLLVRLAKLNFQRYDEE